MANRYNCDVPRVLVTGSVGFLGLRLCERLVKAGSEAVFGRQATPFVNKLL